MKKRWKKTDAFTLIELLVVISIIATLVAIMSVGLRQVKIVATNLRQKGEFHGLEISLELFRNEFDDYPDSDVVDGGSDETCGTQHLAEAMEGRDEQGFHPKSKWHPELEDSSYPLYDIPNNDTSKERKPVYFELKHSGFYTPEELWGAGNTAPLQSDECPMITDVFLRNIAYDTTIDGKVGSPVLYFKADPTKRFRVDADRDVVVDPTSAEYSQWVYDFDDNLDILNLAWLRDPGSPADPPGFAPHYQSRLDYPGVTDEVELFYQIITQREEDTDKDGTDDFYKPYNKDTFILISAGWDGIYGTRDDLTNYNY